MLVVKKKKNCFPLKKRIFKSITNILNELFCLFFHAGSCDSIFSRVKRQQAATSEPKKEESFEIEICKDKDAGEWFRLTAQDGDSCRDVIQCTSSVSIDSERETHPVAVLGGDSGGRREVNFCR